jgi:FkbM family methyltransferase
MKLINFSGINAGSWTGKTLRNLLNLIPKGAIFPILQGPAKGMKWIVGSSDHGCWLGSYESIKQKQLFKYLKPGMVVYDIGAHVGFYTLLLSRAVGSEGMVYAFEPFPDNVIFLRKHHQLNKLVNIIIEEYAISDANGEVNFYCHHVSNYSGSIMRINGGDNHRILKVKTITLDHYVYQHNNHLPDLIKIDIEGAEYLALIGMQNIIKNKNPILLLALHGPDVFHKCCNFLKKFNYHIYDLDGQLIVNYEPIDEIVAVPSGRE